MPIKEALFWVGITVFGTGLFFWVEGGSRMPFAIFLTLAGFAALSYSVYAHHKSDAPKAPVWVVLIAITWAFIAYDIYDRHYHDAFPKGALSPATEVIWNKSFANDQIVLDGKSYRKCRFENVTFLYNGTADWELLACTGSGKRSVRTENSVIKSTLQLLKSLELLCASEQGPYPRASE